MNVKSKLWVFLIILCILFSIATVSASDNQTDIIQGDMDLNQDVLLSNSSKSYGDLYNDIEKSGSTFDMSSDYACGNNESSKVLNVTNLVINGNGHMIDGSNKASGLSFKYIPNLSYRMALKLMQLMLVEVSGGQCIHLMVPATITSMHLISD